MFTIIGGDGKEYGPASVAQLRTWIAAGRASLDTKARVMGSEEWRRLGDFAEFAPSDGSPPLMTTPPALPGSSWESPNAGSETVAPVIFASADGELASVGRRLGAAGINAVLYFFAIIPGWVVMGLQMFKAYPEMARGVVPDVADLDPSLLSTGLSLMSFGLLGMMLVQGILLALKGQNIGKLILGVRVVLTDGSRTGFLRAALLRFFVPVLIMWLMSVRLPLGGLLFLIVDFCFIFRADRRCLHDLMAGTKVVKK